jgi:two-component system sensor kinase FixL
LQNSKSNVFHRSGIIISVNPSSQRILGYSRQEMEGHDVAMIMPAPFSRTHSTLLRRYLDSRRNSMLLNRVTTMFAQHKHGHIFQVRLIVRQIVTSTGTSFLGTYCVFKCFVFIPCKILTLVLFDLFRTTDASV